MTLEDLFARAGVDAREMRGGEAEVVRATLDSRQARAGSVFVAIGDGHSYLDDAFEKGASAAIVTDRDAFRASEHPMALLNKGNEADVHWRLMDILYDHPTRQMLLIGVTGTNGKTTTAWLIRQLLTRLGRRAGYLGTLGLAMDGEASVALNNTTPFAIELYDLLAQARRSGVDAMAMEVSSHALAEKRVDGLEFDVAIFTNLTQDHLDFHRTMEEYRAAKHRLFRETPRYSTKGFVGVTNIGTAEGRDVEALIRESGLQPVTFCIGPEPEGVVPNLRLEPVRIGVDQIEARLFVDGEEVDPLPTIPLGGNYNVENVAAAIAGMVAAGFAAKRIIPALEDLRPVPGRFEPVPNDLQIGVLVDYAHTPDALEKVLDAAREVTEGRLIAVFGCGGDRDRTKRPLMAQVASERADLSVVTSDNPRTEDAQAILDEVVTGIVAGREHVAILDRDEAIRHAIASARPGDTVVIAGKGHEDYQIIGRTKVPMDDRVLAREALEARAPI